MDEPKIMQIGRIARNDRNSERDDPEYDRIYSINGICPTLRAHSGGGLEPKILEGMKDFKIIGYSRPNDDWHKPSTYHTKDIANTIHSFTGGGWNTDQFVLECEMKDFKAIVSSGHGRPDWGSAEYNLRDLSKTIDSFAGSNVKSAALVVEYEEDMKKNGLSRAESMVFEEQPDGGLRGIRTNNGLTASEWYVNGEDTECVPNLRAKGEAKVRSGRIRKLTPRECFRLMNVDEANIDKIQAAAGISETQQYKLAGNSIVVNVLAEIFRKLFIDTEPESGQQLSLF